jgi:hypothetical protein
MIYVAESDAKTESTAAQSAKSAALYREEIFARDTGINYAKAKIQGLEAEMQQASLVIQQQTVSSEITVQHLHLATEATENMRLAHVEGLQLAQTCSAEFAEAHSNYEQECAMYLQSHADHCETYDEHRSHMNSCTNGALGQPPGLPGPIPGPAAAATPHAEAQRARESSRDRQRQSEDFNTQWHSLIPKTKEAEKVHVPPFPTIISLSAWKTALTHGVVQASGNRDTGRVVAWIKIVWAPGKTIEDFASSGGDEFVTLDNKLTVSLQMSVQNGGTDARELKDIINRRMEDAIQQNQLIKGRQIVFLILESFKTFDNSEISYGFDHLVKCECGTDLHAFMTDWYNILDHMDGTLPSKFLRDVFYRKIQHVPRLHLDINNYERLHNDDPMRTYEHLVKVVNQEICLQRQQRNTNAQNQLLTKTPVTKAKGAAPALDAAATPAQTKAQAKAQAKVQAAEAKTPTEKLLEEVQKKLEAQQKQMADVTLQMAAATLHGGKGKGKGAYVPPPEGKGQGGKGAKGDRPCYYHHVATCNYGNLCLFSHANISKEQKNKLVKPGSRASSPSPLHADPKAPQGEKPKGPKGKEKDSWCFVFEKTGACNVEGCRWAHLNKQEIEKIQAKRLQAKEAAALPAGCVVEVCAPALDLQEIPRRTRRPCQSACAPEEAV